MLTCYRRTYVLKGFFPGVILFLGLEDTGRISESLGEMSSEEYEVARILINMKYSGDTDTDTSPRPPVKRDVPVRVPMVMISPWSAVPVSTPYFLWHGKREYVYNLSRGHSF